MLCREGDVEIADHVGGRITPPLDSGVPQRAGKLRFERHARHLFPLHGRLRLLWLLLLLTLPDGKVLDPGVPAANTFIRTPEPE